MPFEATNHKELIAAKAANVARGFLCGTMFCVFPLESYVCRHVIMTNLFQGREAHEGDDHAVLDRWDRRWATTIALLLSVLIPALNYDDVGIVLAWTGTVAATTLTYIGPGVLFIGVHGEEFLDLVESRWGTAYHDDNFSTRDAVLWHLLLMPAWCTIALKGKSGLRYYFARKELMTPAHEYRLGKVKHKRDISREIVKQHKQRRSRENILIDACDDPESERLVSEAEAKAALELGLITAESYGSVESTSTNSVMNEIVEEYGEEDPQDEKQTVSDFAVAIAFVLFGMIAFTAGIISIYTSG